MPDSMTYAMGALVEPLSVAYIAVLAAKPHLGQPVLICGAGPIGMAVALVARASGAHPICITELEDNRLEQAREMGFGNTLKIDLAWNRLETAERVRSILGADTIPQIAFECTGATSSINAACYVRVLLPRPVLSAETIRVLRLWRMVVHCCRSGVESQTSRFP